ncbi:MAG TPA: DUF1223 domain-containing protein [Burkholderiaceae bacterium]|nr:DUF1223 domain-containing protein [Burkholderiaceae bacterium]
MNRRRTLLAGSAALSLLGAAPAPRAQTCSAESGATVPTVVELYTSEGCSSCPPADRWLSTLRDAPGVIAVAFHVDYWDGLGWKDRFASPRYSQRQARLQVADGVRSPYTPQVRVNGRDWRRWPQLPPAAARSTVRLALHRAGDGVFVEAQDPAGAPLTLWWAALEDGHVSDVRAGENGGVRLRHDHVVRDYGSGAPWRGALQERIAVPARGEGGRPLRVIAVVNDVGGAVVQAVQLRCD